MDASIPFEFLSVNSSTFCPSGPLPQSCLVMRVLGDSVLVVPPQETSATPAADEMNSRLLMPVPPFEPLRTPQCTAVRAAHRPSLRVRHFCGPVRSTAFDKAGTT